MTELWVEDLSAALSAASKVTSTSNHVERYVASQLSNRSLPEMPGPVRGEVQAAMRSAGRLAAEGCRLLDALAADIRATAARLQGLQTPPWLVNLSAITAAYGGGIDPAIVRAHALILDEWRANVKRQRDLHHRLSRHGTRRLPDRKTNKAMLAYLKDRERALARWGPRLRNLARGVGVVGSVADFASIYTDRTLIESRTGRAIAGSGYAGAGIGTAAMRGGAPFLLVDGVANELFPDHYGPVSITRANTSTAQGLGVAYEGLFRGNRDAVDNWHLRNRSGRNGIWAATGAYIADTQRGDAVAHHQQALAGEHGSATQNVAVAGETIHEMTTNPWRSVTSAGRFYWDAVT